MYSFVSIAAWVKDNAYILYNVLSRIIKLIAERERERERERQRDRQRESIHLSTFYVFVSKYVNIT